MDFSTIFTLEGLFTSDNLLALGTLTALEIVLGIDNIVFIAILVGRLPEKDRPKARFIGLALAMIMRVLLLLGIGWVMSLTKPLFTLPVLGHIVTGKDLVLLIGGLFLVAKATMEIHHKVEGGGPAGDTHLPGDVHDKAGGTGGAGGGASATAAARKHATRAFGITLLQIVLLDIVFSLDSVITAVGMAKDIRVMIAAVIIAVCVMLACAGWVSRLIDRHPTLKMLALSFLILIGVMLVADGIGHHIAKGYIYFAMAFSLAVEMLNILARRKVKPAA